MNNHNRPRATGVTKFASIYTKLFQGLSPSQISPQLSIDRFWSDLLDLKVDSHFLKAELHKLPKDVCFGHLKYTLSSLFKACLYHSKTAKYNDPKKSNSLVTLRIFTASIFEKNLSGWEVMEIFAGSVAQSDAHFSEFTATLDSLIGDSNSPAETRHKALQLALTFVCGVSQLSPGAYFLRRDFFPAIIEIVRDPLTEQFTFEAVSFITVLANYHKSDAAKLNPYLKQIAEAVDGEFMRKICWASNYIMESSIQAYQRVVNDVPAVAASSLSATLGASWGAVMTRLRPEAIVSLVYQESPKEKFKDLPTHSTVVLLTIYEFMRRNPLFISVVLEDLVSPIDKPLTSSPLPCNIISVTSYLCSHASSGPSPRSVAYANLSLNILLVLVESSLVMEFITQTVSPSIQICRQKPPSLPLSPAQQPIICSVLDCCVLWLRHNLHKRLEIQPYMSSLWIIYRIIWFLQHRRIRLQYDWLHTWQALLGLLNFIASRMDELYTSGGASLVVFEAISVLELALTRSEVFIPTPWAIHQFIYELVRSSSVLKQQAPLLESLRLPSSGQFLVAKDNISRIVDIVSYYEVKVQESGGNVAAAKDVLKVIADDIESNGVHGAKDTPIPTPPTRSEDVLDFGRFAVVDILATVL
ncbi:hypothetical protein CVT24_005342 [Panaeolus cyanescens]|uniref:Armadillo-like helical domain-containing protein n=1 Tax=Panaeolus cyanescens TaxID=181874 RepID=A0A409Y9F4_9AGAR|nr:hypothetical protein CVT24_005342 [Panaeolus cyanescens]